MAVTFEHHPHPRIAEHEKRDRSRWPISTSASTGAWPSSLRPSWARCGAPTPSPSWPWSRCRRHLLGDPCHRPVDQPDLHPVGHLSVIMVGQNIAGERVRQAGRGHLQGCRRDLPRSRADPGPPEGAGRGPRHDARQAGEARSRSRPGLTGFRSKPVLTMPSGAARCMTGGAKRRACQARRSAASSRSSGVAGRVTTAKASGGSSPSDQTLASPPARSSCSCPCSGSKAEGSIRDVTRQQARFSSSGRRIS